jgi:hypothetical protein
LVIFEPNKVLSLCAMKSTGPPSCCAHTFWCAQWNAPMHVFHSGNILTLVTEFTVQESLTYWTGIVFLFFCVCNCDKLSKCYFFSIASVFLWRLFADQDPLGHCCPELFSFLQAREKSIFSSFSS